MILLATKLWGLFGMFEAPKNAPKFVDVCDLSGSEAAHEWLERYLEDAEGATDFVLTGPATNLNWALQRRPQLASKVGRVFWMAGAVDVDGNIRDSDDDKAQESGARVGQGPRRPFIQHHFLKSRICRLPGGTVYPMELSIQTSPLPPSTRS